MRLTLLEMIQHILSAMGSDDVTSYDDTVESYAVAMCIKQAFYDAAVELNLPEHASMFELTASGASTPTLMTMPTNVIRLDKLYYDNKETGESYSNMVECIWVFFDDFIEMQKELRGETSGVGEMVVTNNSESFNFMYRTDRWPRYFTTMDDDTVLFDSYDVTEDASGLVKAKTMGYGSVYPAFTLSNGAYLDLSAEQFPYVLAKAKTRAFNELKQTVNQESAAESRKQKIILQKRKNKFVQDPWSTVGPGYGRK